MDKKQRNEQDLALVYKEFSRARYYQYKRMNRSMKEAEITAQIIRDWQSLNQHQVQSLCNQYLYPGNQINTKKQIQQKNQQNTIKIDKQKTENQRINILNQRTAQKQKQIKSNQKFPQKKVKTDQTKCPQDYHPIVLIGSIGPVKILESYTKDLKAYYHSNRSSKPSLASSIRLEYLNKPHSYSNYQTLTLSFHVQISFYGKIIQIDGQLISHGYKCSHILFPGSERLYPNSLIKQLKQFFTNYCSLEIQKIETKKKKQCLTGLFGKQDAEQNQSLKDHECCIYTLSNGNLYSNFDKTLKTLQQELKDYCNPLNRCMFLLLSIYHDFDDDLLQEIVQIIDYSG